MSIVLSVLEFVLCSSESLTNDGSISCSIHASLWMSVYSYMDVLFVEDVICDIR